MAIRSSSRGVAALDKSVAVAAIHIQWKPSISGRLQSVPAASFAADKKGY